MLCHRTSSKQAVTCTDSRHNKDRERERERQSDRQTDRQTDTQNRTETETTAVRDPQTTGEPPAQRNESRTVYNTNTVNKAGEPVRRVSWRGKPLVMFVRLFCPPGDARGGCLLKPLPPARHICTLGGLQVDKIRHQQV